MNIPPLFLFTCNCVHIQVTALTFLLLFCKTTLALLPLCNLVATFCIIIFLKPSLWLRSEPPFMPPPRWVHSWDWWERAVQEVFSDGEWRENFLMSLRSLKTNLCAMLERNTRPRDETAHAPVPPEMRAAISAACRKNRCKTSICRTRCLRVHRILLKLASTDTSHTASSEKCQF